MAVTVRTYDVRGGAGFWNSDDVLTTLQTAFADVGYHAATQTGTILTFTNTAGTTIAASKGKRYLVSQFSTTGSGVYSTWDIFRHAHTGAIQAVTMVSGGENYAVGNTLLIKGSTIGGVDGTDDITITVSTVSGAQGSTTTWFDVDTATPASWAVLCVNNDKTKKMGQTYYSFYIPSNTTAVATNVTMYMYCGPSFQSATNVFNGVSGLDYYGSNSPTNTSYHHWYHVISKSNAQPLRLITYQSGVDPNFVVFQFADVTNYGDLYRNPLIFSKYNSATQPWSLDDCFTGGIYEIVRNQAVNSYDCGIYSYMQTTTLPKRQGEYGYCSGQGSVNYRFLAGYWESVHGKRFNPASTTSMTSTYPTIYQRSLADLAHTSLEYNPVITGIPINNLMLPVPYFMPSDFGLTEIIGTNTVAYNDLVSVGATTKWKIIQYANNLSSQTYNSSICFVAKTVN